MLRELGSGALVDLGQGTSLFSFLLLSEEESVRILPLLPDHEQSGDTQLVADRTWTGN